MSASFKETGLSPALCAHAQQAGMVEPTPIQLAAIPAALDGRDILATAPTGTGKTAAYALPMLHRLLKARKPRTLLVMVPTRELVLQTAKVFRTCMGDTGKNKQPSNTKPINLPLICLFGGADRDEQAAELIQTSGATRILIATPGRLLDFIGTGTCDLSDCFQLVMDESDRLLTHEFEEETMTILNYLPTPRQTLAFSATMPAACKTILAGIVYKPVELSVEKPAEERPAIRQGVLFLENEQKTAFLKTFFGRSPKTRSIVFVRTKAEADVLAATLKKARLAVAPLHGDLTQDKRTSTVASFGAGRLFILVATDVAARGLDIASVTQVINYDVPELPETYLHRIGRTGRAGKKGSALTLCSGAERKLLRQVEVGAHVKLRVLSMEQALPSPAPAKPRTRPAST
ncbi:RNA helicase [Acetobacter syzygii]|uniref:DEAD/DEAH box helicase n=1 Tax=Acetobacter syzygii TaxID=146476 RepID=UPI0006625EFA|nr:DEAD/DEAH box helicase [Acetobacter syzygii]GBR62406.1 DNA/RNA helicase [Acetobacter syzygii NRIC 0483]GEL56534.1 RNA helicase [Acetobacter syzygii]